MAPMEAHNSSGQAAPPDQPPVGSRAADIRDANGGCPGILPAQEIRKALGWARPMVRGADESLVEPCSYDLRIGSIFQKGNVASSTNGRPAQAIIEPGEIVCLFTLEELDLPPTIAATAFAINKMSSEGLLVLNPGHIDPGYIGPLTVRLINIRRASKAVTVGTKIFTVIFERLAQATESPYPASGKSRQDREIEFNDKDVEVNPGSLTKLVATADASCPFPTKEQLSERFQAAVDRTTAVADRVTKVTAEVKQLDDTLERRIREHWISRVTFWLALIAAICTAITAGVAALGSGKGDHSPPAVSPQNPVTITVSPSPVTVHVGSPPGPVGTTARTRPAVPTTAKGGSNGAG